MVLLQCGAVGAWRWPRLSLPCGRWPCLPRRRRYRIYRCSGRGCMPVTTTAGWRSPIMQLF
jgi:hypothetical protein